MNNYYRAVQLAFRHRLTIVGIALSSLGVALLWGTNITTIYPLVEVVFAGKSTRDWIDEKIIATEKDLTASQAKIEALQKQIESVDGQDAEQQGNLQTTRELALAASAASLDRQSLQFLKRARPWVHNYLPADPFTTLVWVVGLLILGTVIKNVFLVSNVILVEKLAQLATFDLRRQFYRRTLRMDLGAFGEDNHADLMSRFTNDLTCLNLGISVLFGKATREPLKMLACFIGAGIICWRLLLFSLVISPLAIFLIAKLSQSLKRANRRAMEEMAQLYGVLSETFTGIKAVKAYTMERYERSRFHQISKKYFRRAMRIITYNALTRPSTELMGMSIICLAMLAGGYLVLNQQTHLLGIPMCTRPPSFGVIMTFFALLIGASDPARKLADVFHILQRSAAGADRIYGMLDREPAITEIDRPIPMPEGRPAIRMSQVTFRYATGPVVLHDIDLTIENGEALAVVGPNGCGKSTLANLIPRFFDPTAGSIKLGKIDLRQLRVRDWRSTIGLVTQQTLLFDDTIMNNIRYGSPGASDDAVIEAARQANAHSFIDDQLADGYQTIVGESGGRLSGGQRQRIALARAILRDPRILILDEATSQIDLESEQLIHRALAKFMRGRSTIMITHRLTTLDLADRILVMDAGRLIDVGTHDALVGRCDLYRRLYHAGLKESA